uniref:Uncharacterized protein n=1 Tax=mine drainage metagenome TaxID=410659 RepID=E6QQV9_9ZZZZ
MAVRKWHAPIAQQYSRFKNELLTTLGHWGK